jgi:hypothetical protein
MLDKKRSENRRTEERYKASEGAFAAIGDSFKAGQICDIGSGGFSFKYIENSEEDQTARMSDKPLALVSMASYVKGLQFKIIDEYRVPNAPSFYAMHIRKCHVQFVDLEVSQALELNDYIRHNAVRHDQIQEAAKL